MARLLARYLDRTGRPALDGSFLDAQPFAGGVARVVSPRDGRVGVIDRDGQWRIEPRFDVVERFVDGVARANVGGRLDGGRVRGGAWGVVAADGRVVVEPGYDDAYDPEDGRITVVRGGRFGFLDLTGAVVVEPRYEFATWHHDGLAVAALGGGDGYVDRDGNVVIEPRFEEATVFADGRARVKVAGRWGVIDPTGRFVHEPVYERLGAIRDGACWAVKDGRCGVLAADGGIVGDAWFDEIRQADEDGLWPVRAGETWGFLRPDGRVVADGHASALAFGGGRGRVQRDGRWGFVDRDGELVIPYAFLDAFGFQEERAAVRREDGWAFVDPSGAAIGPGGLAAATWFQDGLAAFRQGDRWGYLDRDGAVAIPATFDAAGDPGEGLVAVIAADRAAVPVPGPREGVHVLPEGGLAHPVFDGMDARAHVIAIVGFARDLDAAEQAHLRRRIAGWERVVRPADKLYTEDKWVGPTSVYVRVQGLTDARADVALLVDELVDAGLPIVETLFARWGWPANDKVMAPVPDPRGPREVRAAFPDFPAYWEAVWSGAEPPPAPENAFYLKGAIVTDQGKIVLEERHMPLWFPDVRVCMGALQGQGEDYLEPTEAADELAGAITDAVARRFAGVWAPRDRPEIVPTTRDGDVGVEPIAYDGRRGFACAFDCRDLLHWFAPARVRYRERELLEALREVVLDPARGLEPVILWQRFQRPIPGLPMGTPTVLVVNLWER